MKPFKLQPRQAREVGHYVTGPKGLLLYADNMERADKVVAQVQKLVRVLNKGWREG